MKNLKSCKDCGASVSPNALACPQCGCKHPVGKPPMDSTTKAVLILAGVFVAIGIVANQYQAATSLSPLGQEFKQMADEAEAGQKRIEEAARRARGLDK